MKWIYKTSFGIFTIKPAPQGGYNLIINDEVINWNINKDALADDFFTCHSGHDEWDDQDYVDEPTDLTKWIEIK